MSSNFKNLYTSNNPPIQATLMRGSNIESIHKVHAVITDKKGRVLMCAGNPEYKSFIRSALKPFQAIPFVSSGAASKINNESKSIALACGSHSGSKLHARENKALFSINQGDPWKKFLLLKNYLSAN